MSKGEKKILFIHINDFAPASSSDAIPISQAYILAYLRKHGFDGTILGDYQDRRLSGAALEKVMESLRPAVIGFTAYEENIDRVRFWARYAKRIMPDVLVLLGGPQATFMPGEALFHMEETDMLCRGEGELVTLALAAALRDDLPLNGVGGLCLKNNGGIVETGGIESTGDLDAYPSPYLEGLIETAGRERAILFSSRGCVSPCLFCYTTRASGKKIRYHSIDRVIAEMKYLMARNIRDFWFADPNFAFSRKRLENMLQRMIEETPGAVFWCQTRYDHLDRELLRLLGKAGAHTIALGFESADREVLREIGKGLDPEALGRVVAMAQEEGLRVELFTMFGLPGETFEKAVKTLDFVKDHKVPIEGNSISQQLHLFFGAPLADDPVRHGIHPLPRAKPSYHGVCRDFSTDAMSEEEIRRIGLLWRLNRTDFSRNAQKGTDLFHTAGFVIRHGEDLACRPEADMLLGRIYLQLEEYGAALDCFRRLDERFGNLPAVREYLASPVTVYRTVRRGKAAEGWRVLYDCRGIMDGGIVPATEGYFQESRLGEGSLLPDFEAGITGLRSGSTAQFDVSFPTDYGEPGLAGRTLVFQAFLHLIQEPVMLHDYRDLAQLGFRNRYRFIDLENLRMHNERMYYFSLRDTGPEGLMQHMTDFLKLMDFSLKLGFVDDAVKMAELLPRESEPASLAGKIFLANGRFSHALDLLRTQNPGAEEAADRMKALIQLKRYEEAEDLGSRHAGDASIHILDLRVGLASLMEMGMDEYLRRMDALLEQQVNYLTWTQ